RHPFELGQIMGALQIYSNLQHGSTTGGIIEMQLLQIARDKFNLFLKVDISGGRLSIDEEVLKANNGTVRTVYDTLQLRVANLLAFFHDRLKVYLKDQGIRHDVIDACIAMPGNDDLTLLVKRA